MFLEDGIKCKKINQIIPAALSINYLPYSEGNSLLIDKVYSLKNPKQEQE